ncbi:MAG: Calx-beta domain-containing protein [Mycobacterium sp.]
MCVAEGDAGLRNAKFTVALSAPSAVPVTVSFATANGTAIAGQDYTAAAGTVTFSAGQISRQISVDVTGDRVVEPNETFTVSLSKPTGARLGTVATATATIVNDDLPVVSISPVSLTVVEGNSGVTPAAFAVSLSAASPTQVTVRYATSSTPGNSPGNKRSATAGQDYTAATGTVTFAPGQTTRLFSVSVLGDTAVESDETFAVTLSSPTGAQLGTAKATATIADDDLAPRTRV